jgi:chromosome partitioning protein
VHTLAFVNQKGGCGKTTAAVHLAGALAAAGERVLLVDLDPQAHATLALGCAPTSEPSVGELLMHGLWVEEVVQSAAGGIDLLPARGSLAEFEAVAGRRVRPEQVLRGLLETVRERYDFVLLDCPPRTEGVLAANALWACDTAVLVVEAGLFALHGAQSAIDVLDRLAAQVECAPVLRVVATLFDRRAAISREFLIAIQARHGDDLFDTVIEASDSLREATAAGLPVQVFDPDGGASRCFGFLAEEVREHARRIGRAHDEFEPPTAPPAPASARRVIQPMRQPMNAMALLCNLHAAGPVTLRRLRCAGLHSIAQLEDVSEEKLAEIMNGPVSLARRFVREARQLAGRLNAEEGVRDSDEFRVAATAHMLLPHADEGTLAHPSEGGEESSCEAREEDRAASDDLARSQPAVEATMAHGPVRPEALQHPSEQEGVPAWASEVVSEAETNPPPAWPEERAAGRPQFELPAELQHPSECEEHAGAAPEACEPAPDLWPEWPRMVSERRESATLAESEQPAASSCAEEDPLELGVWPVGGIVHPWGLWRDEDEAVVKDEPVVEEMAPDESLVEGIARPELEHPEPLPAAPGPAADPVEPAAPENHATPLCARLLEGLTDSICASLRDQGVSTLGHLASSAGLELAHRTGLSLPLLLGLGRRARRLLGWPGASPVSSAPLGSGCVDPAALAALAGCPVLPPGRPT